MLKALYARPGEHAVRASTEEEIARFHREGKGCLWVDLESPSDAELGILERVFGFHKLAIESCVAQSHHPRIDDFGDYVYLVVHGVTSAGPSNDVTASRVKLDEIDVFMGPTFLVTFHAGPVPSLEGLRGKCAEVERLMSRGPDRVLAELLDMLAEGFLLIMESFDAEIDTLEDRLFKKASKPALKEIFSLKRDVLHLRRVVNPLREVLNRLARIEHKAVTPEEMIYFRDVYDHLYRVSESLESFRDVLTGAMEVYLTVVSNRINEVMKVLTVCSIILMSATFIAGVYGMNVKLPGGSEWGGMFYVLMALMLVVSGLLLFIFKRRRWI